MRYEEVVETVASNIAAEVVEQVVEEFEIDHPDFDVEDIIATVINGGALDKGIQEFAMDVRAAATEFVESEAERIVNRRAY